MNQTQIRYILAAGWGVYAGVVGGYMLAKRKWKKIADEEIESVKEQYTNRQEAVFRSMSTSGKVTAEELKDLGKNPIEVRNILRDYATAIPEREDSRVSNDELLAKESQAISEDLDHYDLDTVEPEDIESNVFFDSSDFPDKVPPNRKYAPTEPEDPSRPYVISVEEFLDDEPVYDKTTLTYYDGDDTLADDADRVIRSIASVIGDDAVVNFGNRSDDKNTVYVRNERLQTDYEVTLEERSYQEVALGIKAPKLSPRGQRFQEDE